MLLKESMIETQTLHRWINLSKIVAASYLRDSVTSESYSEARKFDTKRMERIAEA